MELTPGEASELATPANAELRSLIEQVVRETLRGAYVVIGDYGFAEEVHLRDGADAKRRASFQRRASDG